MIDRQGLAPAAAAGPPSVRAGDDAMYEQHLHHSLVLRRVVCGCPFCQPVVTVCSEVFGSQEGVGCVR